MDSFLLFSLYLSPKASFISLIKPSFTVSLVSYFLEYIIRPRLLLLKGSDERLGYGAAFSHHHSVAAISAWFDHPFSFVVP